jgi:hypothetical protein
VDATGPRGTVERNRRRSGGHAAAAAVAGWQRPVGRWTDLERLHRPRARVRQSSARYRPVRASTGQESDGHPSSHGSVLHCGSRHAQSAAVRLLDVSAAQISCWTFFSPSRLRMRTERVQRKQIRVLNTLNTLFAAREFPPPATRHRQQSSPAGSPSTTLNLHQRTRVRARRVGTN